MGRMNFRGNPGMYGDVATNPLQKAQIALSNNQPMVAEDICRKRLEKKPNEVMTRILLAQALVQLTRAKEAIQELEIVLKDQPNNVEALLILSNALLATNQMNPPKEAVDVARRAVQLQPKAARTHLQLAEALVTRKDSNGALVETEEAIKLDPRLAPAYMIQSIIYLEKKNWEECVKAAQSAVRLDKTLGAAYYIGAQAMAELKRGDEALDYLQQAERYPSMVSPGQLIAVKSMVFRKQRKYREAYTIYLNQIKERSAKKNPFAPALAALNFALSFFGQNGPYVLVGVIGVLLLLILFGVSKIPVVGGGLNDAILIGIVAVLGWNAIKLASGQTAISRISQPRTAAFAAGAFAATTAAVFGVAWLIAKFTTPAHHPIIWFSAPSFGVAIVLALSVGFTVLNYA